ncbi:hypothetical protein [Pseudoalteromonas tunicata]|uniref:hypothetical protein n=1 Tax=Pseudoalteromonas tunicata TaxID=314281 RepID=UPI00273E2470|nr:hypothetical protein [Pseudoalteromonas tunicata]MDP4983855.1 hypothetical protein [Pseudoalteromonas tunicata]
MKTFLAIVLSLACIAQPVSAEDSKRDCERNTRLKGNMMYQNGVMDNQRMMKMKEMSALMTQIVQEDNLEKRESLMAEHMNKMQENMKMMGATMQRNADDDNQQAMPIDERITMMEGRMNMMQKFIDQLVSHNAQREMQLNQAH